MPQQPNWIDKVNFIRFYLSNPCDFGLDVYFETAWPALGHLSIHLLSFGLDDVIRGFFRPRGLRSARHGRKGRRDRHVRGAIPELGESVAARIPGREAAVTRAVDDGVRHMWTLDTGLQRALYYLLIIDVVTDFWFDWNSGIVADERSNCPTIGRGKRRDVLLVVLITQDGDVLAHQEVYNHHPVEVGIGGVTVGVGQYVYTVSCEAEPDDGWDTPTTVQLFLAPSGHPNAKLAFSSRQEIAPGSKGSFVVTAYINGPAGLYNGIIVEGVPAKLTNIEAFCMQMGDA